jgi:hypothetical protein
MSKRQQRHGLLFRAAAMARRGMAVGLAIVGVLAVGGACGKHSEEQAPVAAQLPPVQATPQNAPEVGEHFIPARKVSVPMAIAWSPRPVVEPANPIAQPRRLDNPGGVNGDRPVRSVLGLAGATPASELKTLDIMPQVTAVATDGLRLRRPLPPASGLGAPVRPHFGTRRAGFH